MIIFPLKARPGRARSTFTDNLYSPAESGLFEVFFCQKTRPGRARFTEISEKSDFSKKSKFFRKKRAQGTPVCFQKQTAFLCVSQVSYFWTMVTY